MKIFRHVTIDGLDELETKTINGSRHYIVEDGKYYPSVTTVLGKNPDKLKGLAQWRKRVGSDEANKISTQSSRRGTRVHSIVEDYLNNNLNGQYDDNPLGLDMFTMIQPTLDDRLDNIYAQEVALYSDHLGVAGRVDCVAEFDDKLSVIDFKTSGKLKKREWVYDYFRQASAYSIMWEERTGMPIVQLVVLIMVEGDNPQIFVEHRDTWTESLLESINYYKREYTDGI